MNGRPTRISILPISGLARGLPRTGYLLDSAHHGLGINRAGTKLCAAGTMSNYAAIVDRRTLRVDNVVRVGRVPYWSTSTEDGPLLDAKTGRLVGINTFSAVPPAPAPDRQNQNYAIAVDHVRTLLPDLLRRVSHGWLGLGLAAPPEANVERGDFSLPIRSVSNPDVARAGVSSSNPPSFLEAINDVPFGDPETGAKVLPPSSEGHCVIDGKATTGSRISLRVRTPDGRSYNVRTSMQ